MAVSTTFTDVVMDTLAVDTISEDTANAGVTVDGVLMKDGSVGDQQVISGDGAITVQTGQVILTKGSAAAITIAAPTTAQDKTEIIVIAGSAQAHVITCATVGFNAKGSSGTVTFTAALGNAVTLRAYNGNWYTVNKNGVTVA